MVNSQSSYCFDLFQPTVINLNFKFGEIKYVNIEQILNLLCFA